MIEVVAYIVVSLLAIGISWYLLLSTYRKSKKRKLIYLALLITVLPLMPYVVVETQTNLFRSAYTSQIQQTLNADGDSTKIVTLKVLIVSPAYVDVYVVVPCEALPEHHPRNGYIAYVLPLEKRHGRWVSATDKDTMMDAVWSDCGSADGNIFPPYPAKDDYLR